MPTRTDWLLRLIAGTEHYDGWIDRLRIMKGMFLFQAETPAPGEVNYLFKPYDYGPFTPEIYRDLEALVAEGFIAESTGGRSYRATQRGRDHLETIELPPKSVQTLIEIHVTVQGLSFRDLLKRVYKAHPASAQRSIAKDVLD